ncbi:hypothetical protein AB833_10665 [Chromatiales bacterium (ex Bugula neritina AB1)]|nr:hypothetical protein AB833_10665 [Chromatiales bacterium (ex Bugula neritina AB1)]
MKKLLLVTSSIAVSFSLLMGSGTALSGGYNHHQPCKHLPSHGMLRNILKRAISPTTNGQIVNGGFELNMWATVVSKDGTVCAVARSGDKINDQWLGSRVISAQKANTAVAFSLNSGVGGLALSTANLFTAVQPGNSLFGLQLSNPVDPSVAYRGNSSRFGKRNDPMVGRRIGGVNVFGGGLALYNEGGRLVGAVGVSGDSSCADHNIAWRVRDGLGLDNVMAGVGAPGDNIIFDLTNGFGHAECGAGVQAANDDVIANCPLNDGASGGCIAP